MVPRARDQVWGTALPSQTTGVTTVLGLTPPGTHEGGCSGAETRQHRPHQSHVRPSWEEQAPGLLLLVPNRPTWWDYPFTKEEILWSGRPGQDPSMGGQAGHLGGPRQEGRN